MPDARPTSAWPIRPEVPCSWGDLFDRLAILELKCERVTASDALAHVRRERDALAAVAGDRARFPAELGPILDELAAVNGLLWTVEDDIRACERAGTFGEGFVALARSVYTENDRRAALKRRVNLLLNSALMEEKVFVAAPAMGS